MVLRIKFDSHYENHYKPAVIKEINSSDIYNKNFETFFFDKIIIFYTYFLFGLTSIVYKVIRVTTTVNY